MKKMIYCLAIAAGICSGDLLSQTVAKVAPVGSPGTKLTLVRIQNGTSLVHTLEDGIRLYAEFRNGTVVKWTATDKNGGNITTTTSSKTMENSSSTKCEVCLKRYNPPETYCYEVDCKDIPKPPSKRVAKPASRTATRY
jgi:hypothetical protein